MPKRVFETDYLVVGTGASAMAFVDTLLAETPFRVVMVDCHHRPGGHWNDAYSFVRLHQPAAFYGVNSRELGRGGPYRSGLNEGYHQLASKNEILDYFDQVMQHFLETGRVCWFPMSKHVAEPDGTHRIMSLLGETEAEVIVHRKLVDATHARTEVPSTHAPGYSVASQVCHIPLNGLPDVRRRHPCYTIVGAGKTGMDACIWLLENAVEPDRIRWIMPRDAWLIDRAGNQPFAENFERTMEWNINNYRAIVEARSIPHLFELLESYGVLLRLDPRIEPRAYHCANVSRPELAQLRRIGDVVRLGRVRGIEADHIVLEQGTLAAEPDALYVDCSACGLQDPPDLPIFDGSTINLLMVRWCQPLFSAALIAFVESRWKEDADKNALCGRVSSPFVPLDWLRMWDETLRNAIRWAQDPVLSDWLAGCRLDALYAAQRGLDPEDPKRHAIMSRYAKTAFEAATKLQSLLAPADPSLTPSGDRRRDGSGAASIPVV